MTLQERKKLLNEYAATSRAFSDAVARLQYVNSDAEAFIFALGEAGTAHRASERSRIKLDKFLAGISPDASRRSPTEEAGTSRADATSTALDPYGS